MESDFRIFDMNFQPGWRMGMNVEGKMNFRDSGRWTFPLIKTYRHFPRMVYLNMQTKRTQIQGKPNNIFIILRLLIVLWL